MLDYVIFYSGISLFFAAVVYADYRQWKKEEEEQEEPKRLALCGSSACTNENLFWIRGGRS